MNTKIVYFDESGDDGNNTSSSNCFILTSVCIDASIWKQQHEKIIDFRRTIKNSYGLHIKEEFHAKEFFCDKDPYRKYQWTAQQRNQIAKEYIKFISTLNISVINVVIDKKKIISKDYNVLEKALTYNIQRIENSNKYDCKYLIITDSGRTAAMRKIARKINVFNNVPSMFDYSSRNKPIKNMIEDILEKDSKESYFIQISDMISYIVNMYISYYLNGNEMPKRLQNVIDKSFIGSAMATLKKGGILNLNASGRNLFGIVIYPE